MVSEQTLISCFSNLGCDISNKDVIEKCLEICCTYNVDEEAFVELWVTHTIPHSLNINPTVEDLNKFEEDKLKKTTENQSENIINTLSSTKIDVHVEENVLTNNVLDIYSSEDNSALRPAKRARSPVPETEINNKIRAVDHVFAALTFTPNANVPIRGPSTASRGEVLLRFGPNIQSWQGHGDFDVSLSKADRPHVPKNAKYMYETLFERGVVLTNRCRNFGEHLYHLWIKLKPLESEEKFIHENLTNSSQIQFRTFGRIYTIMRKDKEKLMIESCIRSNGTQAAAVAELNLSKLKQYSIFPGQIVALRGKNNADKSILVEEFFVKAYALPPNALQLHQDLRVYVAAGPFTSHDNLNYQPLWDLMQCVAEEEPHVLLLIGPFMDCNHPDIENNTLKDTYQSFFHKILIKMCQFLERKSVRVVLISSNRDVHHDPVFPTPEFKININKLGPNSANLYCMPDPSIISINGLEIGITSVDIMRHLGEREKLNTSELKQSERLADYILSQTTFYPLFPPYPGINLDATLWAKYACFDRQPHIMILPSDIKYCCNIVNNCLIINPERLQNYMCAKLCIRPAKGGKWDPNNVSCEIVRT